MVKGLWPPKLYHDPIERPILSDSYRMHDNSFDRLMKIVGALGISFKHSVEIEIEPLESLV